MWRAWPKQNSDETAAFIVSWYFNRTNVSLQIGGSKIYGNIYSLVHIYKAMTELKA